MLILPSAIIISGAPMMMMHDTSRRAGSYNRKANHGLHLYALIESMKNDRQLLL